MKPKTFYNLLAEQNLPLSDQQKEQFERYFELLVEWNEKINLTAITDKEEVYLKHFYDSIAPILQGLIPNETIKLLDIGAGAGFPSLPMKILYPELDVTIIDSLNKRINFLQLLAQEEDNLSYALPNRDPRYITVVEKKKETPNKYPRKAGMPNKRPL